MHRTVAASSLAPRHRRPFGKLPFRPLTHITAPPDTPFYLASDMEQTTIKAEYERYRTTGLYKERTDQVQRFRPVAQAVLHALVSKPVVTNEDLTGLIHLFRPKPIGSLAAKYLAHIIANKQEREDLTARFQSLNIGGYTAPGRLRIHSLTGKQLATVRQFLIDASTITDPETGAKLCEAYEANKVTYVTSGIYSPWLHYLRPEVFPILNNATKGFYRQQGIPLEYPALVRAMPALQAMIDEKDLGLLDSMAWHAQGEEPVDPKNGSWHDAKWIRRIARADWEHFLDSCHRLIQTFQLGPDDRRLVMNPRQDGAQRLSFTLRNRLVLGLEHKQDTQAILLLPPDQDDRMPDLGLSERDPFNTEPPAALYHLPYDKFKANGDALLELVIERCRMHTPHGDNSTYRIHHVPDLYRMATDADFRERALDHLLEGKGEWPGDQAARDVSYWVFQANPKWYDALAALRDHAVDRWSIDVHKQKIKPGDKAIIWITGPGGGCCALATVTSPVGPMDAGGAEHVRDARFSGVHDRVKVTIDHNLWDRPIRKAEAHEHLPDLKAGNQGTTFSATRAQYEFFLQRASSNGTDAMHDLNTILYGPPGTGKTFETVTHALSIIERRSLVELSSFPREQLRQRFEDLVKKRRIVMATFHQSLNYEDFIEGIKPHTDNEIGQVSYSIEAGIFKRVCAEAAFEYVKSSLVPAQREVSFDEMYTSYTEQVETELDSGKEVRIPTRTGKQLQVVDISERGNLKLRHVNHTTSREYVVSLERTRALNAAIPELEAIDNIDRAFREVIGGSNGTAYWAVLNQIRSVNRKIRKDTGVVTPDLLLEDKLPHFDRIDWTDRTLYGNDVPSLLSG